MVPRSRYRIMLQAMLGPDHVILRRRRARPVPHCCHALWFCTSTPTAELHAGGFRALSGDQLATASSGSSAVAFCDAALQRLMKLLSGSLTRSPCSVPAAGSNMLGVRRSSVRRSQCAALLSSFSSACPFKARRWSRMIATGAQGPRHGLQ